eukprot:2226530-Alexandrium_andersonii.AAC.1
MTAAPVSEVVGGPGPRKKGAGGGASLPCANWLLPSGLGALAPCQPVMRPRHLRSGSAERSSR